eukprot:gene13871-16393_t
MVCKMFATAFGKAANLNDSERAGLANLQFGLGASQQAEQQPVDLLDTHVQATTVPGFHEHGIFKRMGATCRTAQAVTFAVWVAARRTSPADQQSQPEQAGLRADEEPHPVIKMLDGIAGGSSEGRELQHLTASTHASSPNVVGQKQQRKRGKRKTKAPSTKVRDMARYMPGTGTKSVGYALTLYSIIRVTDHSFEYPNPP